MDTLDFPRLEYLYFLTRPMQLDPHPHTIQPPTFQSYGLHTITHLSSHPFTWPPPPKMLYGFNLYLLDLYGFSLESCICMDFVWILYRSLGSIWILYGFLWISQICVHSVWMLYPYGFCMDSAWILLDSVSVWILLYGSL